MNDYSEISPENGNIKHNDMINITARSKTRNNFSQKFYKRLLSRQTPDFFKNIDGTIRINAGRIARLFNLSELEEDLLVDMAGFQLEEELTGENPSVETISFSDAYPLLTPDARLRKFGFVETSDAEESPFPEFIIPERMIFALMGVEAIDETICEMTTEAIQHTKLTGSRTNFARKIAGLIQNEKAKNESGPHPEGIILELTGNNFSDLRSIAILALQESAQKPYILRLRSIFTGPEHETEFIKLWNRDSRLASLSAIVELSGEESSQEYSQIIELITALNSPVIVLSPNVREGYKQKFMSFALPELDHTEQDELWETALSSTEGKLKSHIYDLTNSFLLNPSDIARIAALALSTDTKAENTEVVAGEIRREAKKASRPPIRDLATLIEPITTLEDLAVPDTTQKLLKEIIDRVQNNRKVLYDHGFKNKYQRGLAITALFYGESGTGKTHAAEAIAGELDLDLYRIDLSRVISKYIGETEKNLGRIFDGAKNSGSILLFDEADALFGKRSEVADAHDRYANQEISYLLQKMEEYQGLSILTTNLANNMDDAFNRRINYRLVFSMTDVPTRKTIWERIFPKETPTHNLNYAELAKELELTGAEIKNLALRAAYVAAAAEEPVKMKHIRIVLKDELDKIGIRINNGDLTHWLKDE